MGIGAHLVVAWQVGPQQRQNSVCRDCTQVPGERDCLGPRRY